jgi:hypothetical protein
MKPHYYNLKLTAYRLAAWIIGGTALFGIFEPRKNARSEGMERYSAPAGAKGKPTK